MLQQSHICLHFVFSFIHFCNICFFLFPIQEKVHKAYLEYDDSHVPSAVCFSSLSFSITSFLFINSLLHLLKSMLPISNISNSAFAFLLIHISSYISYLPLFFLIFSLRRMPVLHCVSPERMELPLRNSLLLIGRLYQLLQHNSFSLPLFLLLFFPR